MLAQMRGQCVALELEKSSLNAGISLLATQPAGKNLRNLRHLRYPRRCSYFYSYFVLAVRFSMPI